MNISNKILRAINEGVLNALSFDKDDLEQSEEFDMQIGYSKNNIDNSRKDLEKKYYSQKLQEMLPDPNDIISAYQNTHEKIQELTSFVYQAIEWHEKYGATYNPIIDKYDYTFIFSIFVRNSYLLLGAKANANLNWIDTSEVTNMSNTFQYSRFNGDISEWDVSNVTDMYQMFDGSNFDNDSICDWDVSNVKDMRRMFEDTHMQQDLSHWKISNDCRTDHMFSNSEMLDIPEYLPKNIQK